MAENYNRLFFIRLPFPADKTCHVSSDLSWRAEPPASKSLIFRASADGMPVAGSILPMGRMDPENIIKGRIAEAIVEELLRSSGNKVYRFGYESILQNLTQTDSRFDRYSGNAEQVRSIPDFVVVNSAGRSFFVEVKFRADPNWLKGRELKHIKKFWNAKILLVTTIEPYFRIAPPYASSLPKCLFDPLEGDQDLSVACEELARFEPLVDRFLINRTGGHRETAVNSLRG